MIYIVVGKMSDSDRFESIARTGQLNAINEQFVVLHAQGHCYSL